MSEDRIDETRRLYDTVAHTYAEVLPDTRYEAPLELGMLDHFIAHLPDSDLPVLDAGCGTGRMLHYLSAREVSPLVGIDLSPEMIGHARASNPGVPVETGDLRTLPHADSSIRAVLCWYAVIHSSKTDVAAIVREVGRVLIPGGTVLFGFQAGTGERVVERAYGHDVTLHGVLHETREFVPWLNDAGFEVTATADRGPVGFERNSQGFILARRR
ncbi:class I SAM-dependent DNA methyltransferase [Leifsonia flava]|uniref:Class I SAM-dependent methyltransferase n=1 Tax=Orlajensenia leifsoniae TaxID=2561933 RepID=A0A4Y9R231_9MICO|nr:class I SAM-dependent methyltransferase [Leifsonia flava]TFV98744.1 class I SAM-dependent methyltransferase [Leifsonia flava]